VLSVEEWMTIKTLKKKNPEKSNREIARLVKCSHNTVKAALSREGSPVYKRPPKVNLQLCEYHDYIQELLLNKHLKGSRIFLELKSKGYTGGQTALYSYLKEIKDTSSSSKGYTRYETRAGEQSQFDWSDYTVMIGGSLTKIHVFTYINGYSRFRVFEASLDVNQGSVFDALQRSLRESGGVPERIQTDNASVFITNASVNNFKININYASLATHYGFDVTRSLPGHPWSKGKVEKSNQYLEDHFISGNEYFTFEEFLRQLKEFQQKVNDRVHLTTKGIPSEMIEEDRASFIPLPAKDFVSVTEEVRRISSDGMLSFKSNKYSVPLEYACKQAWIKVSRGYFLEVYSQKGKLIASHKISLKKHEVIINKDHFAVRIHHLRTVTGLKGVILLSYPELEEFINRLLIQNKKHPTTTLRGVVSIMHLYNREDFIAACKECIRYNTFSVSILTGFLQSVKFDIKVEQVNTTVNLPKEEGLTRRLHEYKLF
jgi:transposase